MQCEYRLYSIRRVTHAVEKQAAWCEEKVCSIRNVTSAVPGVLCLQYQEKVVCCEDKVVKCEKRVNSTRRLHSQQEDSVCCLRRKSAVSAM